MLIGDTARMKALAAQAGLGLGKFELLDCPDHAQMCGAACALIKEGKGDILVKGHVDSALYVKAIMSKETRLMLPGTTLSHFALFETARYHKLFGIADSAVLVAPNLERKRKIIQNSVDIMRLLGVELPKVAVVCPVEKVNPAMPSTVDAAELAKMSQDGRIQNAVVEGPYDLYIALSRRAAEQKGVQGGQVPGEADILLLPNLEACNPLYKALNFFAEGVKQGGFVAGAAVPVLLPSRTDPPIVKALSIALASFLKSQKQAAAQA
ncbi:MAG: phosphate butyryltransferase [Elusimicrobia bacterium]|nr:phosphate butyryltransferase [Elusimicrobiota bacterium]